MSSLLLDPLIVLAENLDRLEAGDREFAESLLAVPFPSPLQKSWIKTLAGLAMPRQQIECGDVSTIFHAVEAQKNLSMSRRGIRFDLQVENRNCITVVNRHRRLSDRTIYGFLTRDGKFDPRTEGAARHAKIIIAVARGVHTSAVQYDIPSERGIMWQRPEDIASAPETRKTSFKYRPGSPWGDDYVVSIEIEIPENSVIILHPTMDDIRPRIADFCERMGIRADAYWNSFRVRYISPSGRGSRRDWKVYLLTVSTVADAVMLKLEFGSQIA